MSVNGRLTGNSFGNTVAAHLATLREDQGGYLRDRGDTPTWRRPVSAEAGDRVDGDPLGVGIPRTRLAIAPGTGGGAGAHSPDAATRL